MSEILKEDKDIYFSISTTTREIRKGEVDGINYHYISKEQFKTEINEGLFLEWAEVHENYYGTSLKPIEKAIKEGKLVVFDIDVQGHEIVKKRYNHIMTSLFITTPDVQTLEKRLTNRNTDTLEVIQNRIQNAKSEMARVDEYDYLLINDYFEKALDEFKSVVKISRLKQFQFRW